MGDIRIDGTEQDWKSFYDLGLATGCRAMSLSCRISLEAAREVRTVHERWKTASIAQATLAPEHGMIRQTGQDPKHYSVWLTRVALSTVEQLFKVIE
jgi:hypothetical protein